MASEEIKKERGPVLDAVSSFFEALRQPAPRETARNHVFEAGFHFVPSGSSSDLQQTLGEMVAGGHEKEGSGNSATTFNYKLSTTDPAPEVWVYEDVAGVWAAVECVAIDESTSFRSYAAILLVRPGEEGWKISGFAHPQPPPTEKTTAADALPPVKTELAPEVERLLHFPRALLTARSLDILPDWLLPGARMVRHRVGEPPNGALVVEFVQPMMQWALALPPDAKWDETLHDVVVRTVGDFGFIWMNFATTLGGKPFSAGIDLLVLRRQGDRWLFGGTQTYSIPNKEMESAHPEGLAT